MYFKCILLLTLTFASKAILVTSTSSGAQADCTGEQFKCANGKCILSQQLCDGRQQCHDGSDELNCTSCTGSAYSCGDGMCIHKGSLCDLYEDCKNGTDENNCTNHLCGSDEFRCQSGQCIDKRYHCNARVDCADKSDEENCLECFRSSWNSTENSLKSFKCVSNKKCIFQSQVCNSIKDCPDGSDEDEETCQNLQCPEDHVQCGAGHCVRSHLICEGWDPCGENYKTEKKPNSNCTKCPSDMFKCKTEEKCVDLRTLCDTVPDCEDGSDESESTCSVSECWLGAFRCQSGQCVGHYGRAAVCNGHYDCKDESDKSDEANCTTCSPEAIKCGSGECVNKFNLCNSITECSDGSDENDTICPHGSTPPVLNALWPSIWKTNIPSLTLQHLTKDLAVYFDGSVSPSVTWPFFPLSQAWKYAKETFEFETLSEPGSKFLYVVIGKSKSTYPYNFSFRSWDFGYRNIIFPRLRERNGWATENSENFEKLIYSLGYIVKIAGEGVRNYADYKLCDSSTQDIVFYDIYIHLKGQVSADVMRWRANQFNQTLRLGQFNCFRDWFLPVYEKYGGAAVLKNYFQIFKRNWPKKLAIYSELTHYGIKQLNVGELVHFWSGAAGEDLRYLAKSAFHDWNDVFTRQFAKAQIDFPDVTYSGEAVTILNVLVGASTCILILLFITYTIKASLPHIKKKYTALTGEYW